MPARSPRYPAFLPDEFPYGLIRLIIPQEFTLADVVAVTIQLRLKSGHEVLIRRECGEPLAVPQPFQVKNVEDLLKRPLKGHGQDGLAEKQGLGGEGVAAGAHDVAAGGQVVKKAFFGVFLEG